MSGSTLEFNVNVNPRALITAVHACPVNGFKKSNKGAHGSGNPHRNKQYLKKMQSGMARPHHLGNRR